MPGDMIAVQAGLRGHEFIPHMVCTATGGYNDVVERRKKPDEVFFGRAAVSLTSAVRHRLSATGLVERVFDVHPQSFQKLKRGDADLRIQSVHIAGNDQTNSHPKPPLSS